RVQRSSGSAAPSRASGEAAKAGHQPAPIVPIRMSVAALRPPSSGGTPSSGPGWKPPRGAIPLGSRAASSAATDGIAARPSSGRPVLANLRPVHDAARALVERVAPVHGAAIVPDEEIAGAPAMRHREFGARRMRPE